MRAPVDVAVQGFERHDAFEQRGERTFAQTTTPFEATASVVGADGDVQVHVSVTLQSLDAAVADESVPEVVESGWFETFERRVADATTVTGTEDDTDPDVTRGEEVVTIDIRFDSTGDRAVDDAKAVVNFVEATWIQGLVPGYEYDEPAASLLGRARNRS